jgi:hypothetical protein
MRTLLFALAALGVAGAAHAAGAKQAKDWLGVCANTAACTAFGFGAEEDATGAYLMIQRDGGPVATPKVTLVSDAGDKQPAATWTLTLDGRPIPGVGPVHAAGGDAGARAVFAGAPANALVAALRNGQSLEFSSAGKSVGEVSLAGSAAILLWVDDQQGRVGTVTALARPGPKPASAVPPPVALPLIAPAASVSQAGVPAHAPKTMIKGVRGCDLDPGIKDPDDVVARLAPGLMLWGPECDTGAYNALNVFFLGDERGGNLKRISFTEPPGADQAKDDRLINAQFDPKTQTLSTFSKARGVGDCGDITDWVWDGRSFGAISEEIMPACRGVPSGDWPALFVSRQK